MSTNQEILNTNGTIPCPKCEAQNKQDDSFCKVCGTQLIKAADNAQKAEDMSANTALKYVEPSSAFAQGLPAWDLVPPQVIVRRPRAI